jgi:hypothetical protein
MKPAPWMVFAILALTFLAQKAIADTTAFDGTWSVTVDFHEYKNPDGSTALPTARHFLAKVKNGILHGELGTKGAANWYELTGKIEADGAANLHVNGTTGDPKYTPNHPHPGLPFAYEVTGHFEDRHGTGKSVGNPARVRIFTFVKE